MLKPLDLQTVMPRTMDLQKMQQVDHSRPVIQQQEESREGIKQAQLRQEIVQTNEAIANPNRIHDQEGEQRRGHSNRRYNRFHNKPEKEVPTEEKAVDGQRGQHIDIKM
ncbi:MAG TPA: hypothetical protein VHY08_04890 [Bacillota bacterium]|nr:hypothetical protein [Bacillota bacterium]